MRAVVQRVSRASVSVGDDVVGAIGRGLLVLVGAGQGDDAEDVRWLAQKIAGLRIFPDAAGKMNHSLTDCAGELLAVSQFTLFGDCRKGRRPSFGAAMDPEPARDLYDQFVDAVRALGVPTQTGRFQATMAVESVNEGPVTLLLDSRRTF